MFSAKDKQTVRDMNRLVRGELSDEQRKSLARTVSKLVDELAKKREAAYAGKGIMGQLEKASEEVDSWDKRRRECINYGPTTLHH